MVIASPSLPPADLASPLSARRFRPYLYCPSTIRRQHWNTRWVRKLGQSVSASSSDAFQADHFGGWEDSPAPSATDRGGWKRTLAVGIGGAAILAAVLSYSISPKGFKYVLGAPLHAFYEKIPPLFSRSRTSEEDIRETSEPDVVIEEDFKLVEHKESFSRGMQQNFGVLSKPSGVTVATTYPADAVQEEAFLALKRLEVIDSDCTSSGFCTRREFARWLVRMNIKLERKMRQRIDLSTLAFGSTMTAFDDVTIDDPDFWCIQALGEAGIVFSKLSQSSSETSANGCYSGSRSCRFLPDSYLSRLDLLNWKAALELPPSCESNEQVSPENSDLLDLNACKGLSTALLMDLKASGCSTVRKAFGNTRCLQPQKPVMKVQAAVALMCGRMGEVIQHELSRLEEDNRAKRAQMAEIQSELTDKGEIRRFWEGELKTLQARKLEIERNLEITLAQLSKERASSQEELSGYMMEKAALDIKNQLMLNLKSEVDEMSDQLATDRPKLLHEQQSLQKMHAAACLKLVGLLEAKSILEAEKEALQILRSWVEEEAMRNGACSQKLEQALKRWRYSDNGGESSKVS